MHGETQPLTDWKQHTLTNTSSEQRFSRIDKLPNLRPPYIQPNTFPQRRFCILTWAGFYFHMRVKSSSWTWRVPKQEKKSDLHIISASGSVWKAEQQVQIWKKKTARKCNYRRTVGGLQFRSDLCSLTAVRLGKRINKKPIRTLLTNGKVLFACPSRKNGLWGMVRSEE